MMCKKKRQSVLEPSLKQGEVADYLVIELDAFVRESAWSVCLRFLSRHDVQIITGVCQSSTWT
jgi:hypothetical protein